MSKTKVEKGTARRAPTGSSGKGARELGALGGRG